MGILVAAVRGDFVARVSGLDLSKPLDDGDFGQVRDAFHRYAVLVFPEQRLTDDEQIAFSERFGPLEVSIRKDRQRRIENPRVSDISNVDEKDRVFDPTTSARSTTRATGSGIPTAPSSASRPWPRSSRGARCRRQGGETEYADLRGAWDALPAERKRGLDALVAEHSFVYSRGLIGYDQFTDAERAEVPPVPQAVVRTHPATGRKSLYLGSHASYVIGRPVEEGRALLKELLGVRHAAAVRLPPRLEAARSGHVGQPLRASPRPPVGRAASPPRHAPDHGRRRRPHRRGRPPHPRRLDAQAS